MKTAKKSAPRTRDMERINWIEFREWVPAKIDTVLLPLGTLEPHGVAPNGTDILAPVAMAREVAPRQRDDRPCDSLRIYWNLRCVPWQLYHSRRNLSRLRPRCSCRFGQEQIQKYYFAKRPRRRANSNSKRACTGNRARDVHETFGRKLVVVLQRCDLGSVRRGRRSRSRK